MKNFKMYLLTAVGGTILAGTVLVLTASRIQAAYTKPVETPASCNYRPAGQCGNGGTLMVLDSSSDGICKPSFCYYAPAR